MKSKKKRFSIGLRTLKTAAAVVISMVLVDAYGTTSSKLIFAMLGAMAAMEPTFKESLESCMTQAAGMFFGAVIGVLLLRLPVQPLAAAGIGIVIVITLYNGLRIRFSPSLPCLIVATICTTPDIQPITYAVGRFWDTAIGLIIGMLINTLIFPYDNSRKIRDTAESLDREVLRFLEDMFDGDDRLPDTQKMNRTIDDMDRQMAIFSNQLLLLHLRKNKRSLESFRNCEGKARQLIAHMEVLSRMKRPGRLSAANRSLLKQCGAQIRDRRNIDVLLEEDIVTNYHVSQLLKLRRELLNILKKQ